MTGRGSGRADADGIRVDVELSSVNRRQLDLVLTLPRSVASLEADVHSAVQARLVRGRVSGTVRVSALASSPAPLAFNRPLAAALAAELRAVADACSLAPPSADALLAFPGVLDSPENDPAFAARARPALLAALSAALDDLCAFRLREGANLAADLASRLATLSSLLDALVARAPLAAEDYARRLRDRVSAALDGASLPLPSDTPERIVREVALFTDRTDVTEELVRLRSHLSQFADALRAGGPVGRRLDFLAQEAGREINTVGSKANDAPLTRLVLDFKSELERVREQIQNIE
jgi:uncharacterized protein (TIGR00255 family)